MKYYKRLPINRKDPVSNRFAVQIDGSIVTDSKAAIAIPDGNTAQRPVAPIEGMLRFNNQLNYFETYTSSTWHPLQAVTQMNIVQQEFDNGDYADVYFGPLAKNVDITKPQNVFVYVENVPQISNYNFTLEYGSTLNPITTSTTLTSSTSSGVSILHVASVADFNAGQYITGPGIQSNTTVTATSVTNLTINLSLPTNSSISAGTTVTTTLATGTWIRFSDHSIPVPNKPVFAITGLDGNA